MDKELRILILEEVPADAALEEHELRKAGLLFTSKVVDTKEAFLRELDEFFPDLILSDYDFPSFNGLEALTIAKEKSPDVPFIFVSGKLGEEFAIENLKKGATDYVLKNNIKRLVPSVKRALEEAKLITEHKQAGELLREKERLLSESQRIARIGSWGWNLTGPIKWTDETYRIYGVSPETFTPTIESLVNLLYPEDRPAMQRWLEACRAGQSPDDLEFRVILPDGSVRLLSGRGELLYDIGNRPVYMTGTVQDITERKRTEEEMQLNELRLSSLFELSQKTNQPIQALTEVTLEKAIELTRSTIGYLAFLNEDETVLTMYSWSGQAMQECMIQEKPLVYSVETTGLWGEAVRQRKPVITNDYQAPNPLKKGCPEGHVHVNRHMNIPLFDGDKIVIVAGVGNKADPYDESDIRQLTFLMDGMWKIIKRKQTEDALRESEEKYHSVMDNASDAILLADIDGKLLEVNKKAAELLGYTKDELMTMNYTMIHPPEDLERTADAFREIILKGFTYLRDGIVLRKDGETVPVDITGSLIVYGDKLVLQGIIRDITERKRAEQEKRNIEEQLFQAQKMETIGQLAGGVAHDFNNILMAMIGYGHLLKMKLKEDDPLRTYADHILSLSDRAANLTRSLLAFSRKQIINPRPVDINEIIRRIDHLLSRIIGEDIQLLTMISEEDLIVMADPGQIEQVLMNLAANARDAMPKGGLLTVGTETADIDHEFIKEYGYGKEGEYALIAFTDTGAGMDIETREKIFEPFFTTKEVGKGTGLGLSMVYGIIKQHDGYINVYSEPDIGTTFRIYLPLIKGKVEKIKPEVIQPVETGRETVLLAEDETAVREFTKKLLEEYGYKVITAASGQEAINEFKAHKDKIQLVLLDVIMPNRNGREAYEEIKKIVPDIKALFMSGHPADVIHKHGILEKGFAYIEKPASPLKLLKKIREVLDNKS